ncbi:CoB--CoM heterodisulfide reductase iron-sulfur subunit A family protein [candidate division TA06 bacterium]|uniref:CoB--CoM heterodisulfide reductase iron-sulfur subunit A family protein n=1 Tax=candidate division TA06 bacterium TaxID=2250710 RepID=A0A933IE87_UNCT6|nr:CoB--CoM heterodisulfide reductase iron-sulfur subunit A family protein [candidate division TA06 bacterium]
MERIGVFVCHCGLNIAGTVDVKKVVEAIAQYPGVVQAEDYKYMCSDPGQNLVVKAIKDKGLTGVVVAACSPTLHEPTFRKAAERAGLNPYKVEIANIREHCSWVHDDKPTATAKAIRIVKTMVKKVIGDDPLETIKVEVTKKALVLGGGVTGIQAALDIANSGYPVILVEKEPSIGGHMAQLSETFPTLDCSQCILTPKMVEAGKHPNICLMTYSEVEEITGYVGNFKAKIRKKASCVDNAKCNGCGLCSEKCPSKTADSEFECGLAKRKAIYTPFPQAVPNKPVLDKASCAYFLKGTCGVCKKICPVEAIDYEQKDEFIEEQIGAVVVATGYDLYPKEKFAEYGYGKIPDVIDGLQFERLLSASGPTEGEVKRPSDGKIPQDVVFIQCAGSRDPERAYPYCSKICCMYTAKHAKLYKHKVHSGQPYIFYIDIRAGGKRYEEFVQQAIEEEKIVYLRGKVSKVFQDGDKVMVWGEDTLLGKKAEISADMVVLATAIAPQSDSKELSQKLKIATDEHGYFSEAHPKLRPVESNTAGFFLAGAAQAPKDIPEAVAQAGGAAAKVVALFSGDHLEHEPIVAAVDEDACSGCRICITACPYQAREFDAEKKKVKVNEILCEGCGACVAACPSGATSQRNYKDDQIYQMIAAALEE